jgi:flagellar basal-body rod protein FlgF
LGVATEWEQAMENALLVGLSRQMALRREMDVIANNVANINTNGFKTRSTRFAEHVQAPAKAETFPNPDKKVSFVVDRGTPIDLSAGMMERTGNPLDVAVRGDAYFTVQGANGQNRFTRDGAFEINGRGQLVTQGGLRVMGEGGPIEISTSESNPRISEDGTLFTDQGNRGKLRLARFANPRDLRNEGGNLFSSVGPAQPAGPQIRVESGVVERSNVKPVLEMSRLVEVQRAYSSITSMMGRTDELRRDAIRRLADVQS